MKEKRMLNSVSYVMIIMIISKIFALLSQQIYMSFYGIDDIFLNIYSYAIAVPNTIFNCFGTALSTVVIPIYAGHLAKKDNLRADRFANNIITIATVLTLGLVFIGMAISPFIVKLTSFTSPEEYRFAVKALMIIMPVMLFYGLNYIFQGMLQSNGKYGWPAFVSVPSSVIVIGYVLLLGDKFRIKGLLVATLLGLAMQAIILIPPLLKTGYRYKPLLCFKDEDIITSGKMTLNVLLGVSAYQINMFYNTTMISRFEGMTTLLTFVQKLSVDMVFALAMSITSVLYPKLTEKAALGDMDGYKDTLNTVLSNVTLLLIPITFGIIAVRKPMMQLITNWGKITEENVDTASKFIALYAIGTLGYGAKEIMDRAFYAIKNTRTSAINGFIIMLVNVILSLILIRFIGAYGIPLAYSISSLTGFVVLITLLNRKIGWFMKGFISKFLKSIFSAFVMAVAVTIMIKLLSGVIVNDGIIERVLMLGIPAIIGVIIYAVMLVLLKVDIAIDIFHKVIKNK